MSRVAIKGSAYCLEHVPQLGLHYGNTPYTAGEGEKEYLQALPKHLGFSLSVGEVGGKKGLGRPPSSLSLAPPEFPKGTVRG